MLFFKNMKLMFCVDAVLCVMYARNKSPSHALGNKTPYEIWYGCIPLVRHLEVFCSTYYAVIPKEQKHKLGARSQKCIFLGYSNTTKAYRIYNEVNKKFILSRHVVFIESTKNDKTIEQQLDHLDRFTNVKTYHEFDDEIQHLEGRIPILDQPLESPFEVPSPPHEEDPTTSSKQGVQLHDVIERIERLNLDGNATPSQSVERPGPSQKGPPKWLIKTLESVHPNEVGKTGTKSSTRRDGGDVDNSYSGDVNDIDVSYDRELNLSTNFEPTSFEEVGSHYE
jgi:hypothetical protein